MYGKIKNIGVIATARTGATVRTAWLEMRLVATKPKVEGVGPVSRSRLDKGAVRTPTVKVYAVSSPSSPDCRSWNLGLTQYQ